MAGTVVICFTDIVGSTELSTRLGDDRFDDLRRRHFDLLERQVETHGGEVVKSLGDGLMLAFGSASDAVSAAVAMQRAIDAASRGAADRVEMRVGISAGDATREGDDWFGVPVVEGSRLCAAAAPGQILVSEVVRLLSGSRGGHEFRSLGTLELKGIPEPVGAADVAWTPAAATLAAPLPGPLAPDEGEWPFAGRDVALDQLGAEWKAAAAGERRVVMIAGEPGIGKTRLVAELARSVHADGALVLLGRTDEHVDAPYGPWREALRALVRSAPEEMLDRHVAEHGGELARIVPELARRVEELPAAAATDPETERLLLFEAVAGLLAATSAETPVLLVLDDLHWADRSTLLLLLHVLKADAPASVLIVATYRDTDVDRALPLAGVLADLRRLRGVSRLMLGGLDGDGIAALLERAGGHDLDDPAREFAATLWRDTDGNPFFVREVLLHLIETGGLVQHDGRWRTSATLDEAGLPEGVREVIGRRLAELPDATNTMLGAASVIGREFDTGLLAEIAGESADVVLEALEPAERARLIGNAPGRPGRYSFAHALVRTVLVDELGTNRRVRLHRAAGVALEAQPDPPLGELAYHFGEAAVMGETDRAVRYARAAAEQALDLAAPEEAVTFARRALDAARLGDVADSERPGLLLLLGRALDGSGALEEAKDVVADACARADAVGDIETACAAAIEYGSSNSFFLLDDERGPAQLRAALALLLSPGDSPLRAGVLARYAQWLTGAPGDVGLRTAREAYDMAVRVDAQEARQVAANAVAFMVTSIDPAAQLRFGEEALAIAVAGSEGARFDAYAQLAQARVVFGDLEGADATIAEMDAAFEASGLRALASYRASHKGLVGSWWIVRALIAGRFADAEAIVAERDAMPREDVGAHFGAANARTQIAYLRGDWKGATARWAEVRGILPTATEPYFGYLGTGGDLDELRQYWQQWAAVDELRPAWTRPANTGVLAESLRRLQEPDAAATLHAEFADHSGYYFTNGIGWFYGPFDTALGILAATAGDVELASQAIAQARGAMTDIGMPGWLERLERLDAGDLQPWRI